MLKLPDKKRGVPFELYEVFVVQVAPLERMNDGEKNKTKKTCNC